MQLNLETIWNLVGINGKQTLVGNVYIPPSDSEMVHKLDLELEKYNDIPLLLLGGFMPGTQFGIKIVKHLTKMVKFWKTL